MNWKRIFRILITLLVIAGIAWAAYYFFYQNPATSSIITSILQPSAQTEQATTTATTLMALTTDPVFDYWLNQQTNEVFLMNPAGQVLKLSGTQEVLVNSQTLSQLNHVAASAKGDYLLAEFNYPAQPVFSIFNASTNNWSPLPSGTIAAAWAPNANKVAYVDGSTLTIFDVTTNKKTVALRLTQKELNLQWTTDNTIILSTLPTTQLNTQTWTVDLAKGTIVSAVDAPGAEIQWAKDG
ncbi:MAG: hypothetical protein KGI60_03600, partial [Patescibacteria group bacterium]|nr:hypothetical protein [Patescibacteria group bacterium]